MVYCASKLFENLKLFYKSNFSARDLKALILETVLPKSQVGYHAGKPIVSVFYCLKSLLFGLEIQWWNPDNSKVPWISPHFSVIFTRLT